MTEDKVKQVIVMRTDLNMRKGKMIAQGAHASMMFLSDAIRAGADPDLSHSEVEWLWGTFTKVCVSVNSLEELERIYLEAYGAGLTVCMVEDSGLTEFHGVPTKTCLAIGPAKSSKIDAITGELKLL